MLTEYEKHERNEEPVLGSLTCNGTPSKICTIIAMRFSSSKNLRIYFINWSFQIGTGKYITQYFAYHFLTSPLPHS